ncbi:MAG: acyl-CoA/acyl-ACP dehydrogenase [Chloroflexi bacterium]|nr:acyl-CoA/acyl-ACP dehydrogenase [Chloroflexota bacterium]
MLRETAADYFRRELPRLLVKQVMDGADLPRKIWDQMATLGFMGLEVPKEYGGAGGTFVDSVVLLEEMGRACLPGPFFSTVIIGASLLLEAGNRAQKEQLLPGVAEGKVKLALAALEQDAANDPEYCEVRAAAEGDHYRIDGVKSFVPDGEDADLIVCLARAGAAGLTLFLVPRGSPGLRLKPLPRLAWEKQNEVTFEGVSIPSENVLGAVGLGGDYYRAVVQRAAIAKCAEMVGGCDQVVQMTVQYAKERAQFGHPIGSFQAIQHHCANMLLDLEVSRYLTWQAAWRISQRLPCTPEAAMAKAWVNQACHRVTVLGHQVHGAIGYCWDHDMHLYYKQARMGELSFGDTSHYKEIVATELGL